MLGNALSLIAILLAAGCPATIVWGVIAVVVDAVNGVIGRWLWTHVENKIAENTPPLADCDAAFPVVLIIAAIRVIAALKHVRPCSIFWRTMPRMVTARAIFCKKTAAGTYEATSHRVCKYYRFIPAVTLEAPDSFATAITAYILNCNETPVSLSSSNAW